MEDRAVSLNAVLEICGCSEVDFWSGEMHRKIEQLPPVTPQRPIGYWIPIYQGDEIINYRCSECEFGDTSGSTNLYGWNYCRRCGTMMFEPQNLKYADNNTMMPAT